MCKYLSGVSGPAQAAVCTCTIAMRHSHTRASARTHTRAVPDAPLRRPQYASGSRVNTCIKMSAFACLHPLPGILPRAPCPDLLSCLPPTPPSLRGSRTYTDAARRRRRRWRRRRVYAQCENVFGSGTCQPNVNLSGTSRNDYVHDLHRHARAVLQSRI